MTEPNCLPMCSLCAKPPPGSAAALKRCASCKTRTYCNKQCQKLDWKHGGHKKRCGVEKNEHTNADIHEPWCAYLDRDPELDNDCLVETDTLKSNPRELITTGMNTCIFVVIKTEKEIVGWHASMKSLMIYKKSIKKKLSSITGREFVAGFIVPGEDRQKEH